MQICKRFTIEQVRALLKRYCQGTLDGPSIEEILGVNKARFFALLRQYHYYPDKFSLAFREPPN